MTHSTRDVHDALSAYADTAPDLSSQATVDGVASKVSHTRHVRAAGAAAVLALIVAVGTVWGTGIFRSEQTMPAPHPPTTITSGPVPTPAPTDGPGPGLAQNAQRLGLPLHVDGLALKEIRRVPTAAGPGQTISLPSTTGEVLGVALGCPTSVASQRRVTPDFHVYDTAGKDVRPNGAVCFRVTADLAAEPGGMSMDLLLVPGKTTSVRVSPSIRFGASAEVGLYVPVPWSEYPFDQVPLRPRRVTIDGVRWGGPISGTTGGFTAAATENPLEALVLNAPRGRFRLTINGRPWNPCPRPESTTTCRNGELIFWQPVEGWTVDLLGADGTVNLGQQVTIRVTAIEVDGSWTAGIRAGESIGPT